jgi:arylformamidase
MGVCPDALCGAVVGGTSISGDHRRVRPRIDIPAGAERVLLKTRNHSEPEEFHRDFLRLTRGARFVVARGSDVGIDYLSVGDHEAHRELLGAGVVPVEGLDPRKIEPGEYTFVCLPLDLVGTDGAPARAILID